MVGTQGNTLSESGTKMRNVFFVLLVVGLFVLKKQYAGPCEDLALSYAGNFLVSFALYFVFINPPVLLGAK